MTTDQTPPFPTLPHGFVALVVDHDPASRRNLCGLIESDGGRAIEAKDGTGALTAFRERRPDIVLLDTTMRETGGFDTCSQLQALPNGPDTPVLLMVAFDDETSVNLALAVGAADYVTKPIRPAVLRQRMRRILEAHYTDVAILRAKKEWEAAVDAISDMVILTDANGRIIRCNLATIQRLQTTYSQLIGRDLASILFQDKGRRFNLSLREPHEIQFPALKGRFEVRAFPAHVEGRRSTIVYVLQDVTQRRQYEEDLQPSGIRFEALVENISEGVELFDAEGRVLYASPIVSRILGMPEGTNLAALNPMDHLHPDDLERGFPLFLQMLQTPGGSFTFEMRTQQADGSWIWAEATARNMLTEAGIHAILMNFRDITFRKQLEEALRHSEQRFKALTENISEGIMLCDAEGKILYISPAVTRLTGYGQEVLGESAFLFIHPDELPTINQSLIRLMERPEEYITDEVRAQHKDGSWIWIEFNARNMFEEAGINSILLNFKDVTRRKRTELQLRQLSQAVEQSPVSIVITDTAGKIEYANTRFTQLTGYTLEETMGQNPRLLKSEQTPPETFDQLWSHITTGLEWHGEFINKKKNGEIFTEKASVSPVTDEKGVVTHFLALKEDITERKQLEETLRQNEKRFRAMIENSAAAITLVNAKGIITYATPAITAISGYELAHYVGQPAFAFMHPDDLSELMDSFVELARSPGSMAKSLFRSQHIDGSWRWVDVTTSNQLADPAVQAIIVNFRDVTENKRAEEKLRQTEERLRLIVETVPIPILISSAVEGAILFANTALCEMVGLPAPELLGQQTPNFYVDPSDRESMLEALKRNGKLHNYELAIKGADQTSLWVLVSMQPLTFGDQPALLAVLYDVTEHKQAEEALHLSEERFQLVTHATNDAVWDLNLSTSEIWWNGGISSLFGYAGDQIGNRDDWWEERIHPDDRAKVLTSFRNSLTGDGQFWSKEYRFRRANGTYAHVFDRAYIIPDEHGIPVRAIGAIMDITDRKQSEEALRAREQQLEEAQHTAHLGSWEWDFRTNTTFWSDELYRLCGWEPRSITPSQEAFLSLVHPDDQDRAIELVGRTFQTYQPYDFDYRIISAKGEIRWLHGHGEILHDAMREPMRFRGTVQDITERKQAEEALRASRAELSEALQIAKLAYWEYDITTDLFSFNDHFYSILHTTVEQEGGYTMSSALYAQKFCHPDDEAVVRIEVEKALVSTERHYRNQLDHRILYADGGVGSVSVRINVERDEQGQVLRFYGANQDVSERKQMEEALRQSEELFSKAFHASPAPMGITCLDDGMVIDVNTSWEKLLGFSRQEVIGRSLLDLNVYVNPDDRVKVIQQVREQGRLIDHELKFKTRSEEELVLLMSSQRVAIQGLDCLMNAFYDITELRRMHEAMLASQKLADLGTLAAGVAHEMNSPLQVITGVSQSLLRKTENGVVDSEQLKRNLDVIHRNGWRCAEIVRSLHTYARNPGGAMEPAELNDLVSDALLLIEHQLKSWANISVRIILAEELPAFTCDRNQITQVLINLLTNARDAMSEGGEITIATDYDPKSDQLLLQISDTGIGIPDSIRNKIFDPFFTTKPLGKGTGLGLSIVDGIVRAHGGTIAVDAALSRGTTFTTRFPVKPLKLPASEPGSVPGRFHDIARATAEQTIA